MRAKVVGRLPVLLAALASASTAAARDEPEVPSRYALASVRGAGAESCPGTRELAREVERRLGRVVFDAEAQLSLEVHLLRHEDGFRSQVFVRDAANRTIGERELFSEESSCFPLFSATALALALFIDPDASLVDGAAASSSVGRVDAVAAAAPPAPRPSASAPAEPSRAPAPVVVSSERAAPRVESRPGATVQAGGFVGFGVVPRAAPGVALAFGSRFERSAWGFELTALYVASRPTEGGSGEFSVGLTAAGVAVTYEIVASGPLRVNAHAGPWVGALHAAVRDPDPRDPGDFLYFAAGVGARTRLRLGRGWFTELAGEVRAPLVRRGFFVSGVAEPVWRQPAVSADLGLGVGLELL